MNAIDRAKAAFLSQLAALNQPASTADVTKDSRCHCLSASRAVSCSAILLLAMRGEVAKIRFHCATHRVAVILCPSSLAMQLISFF